MLSPIYMNASVDSLPSHYVWVTKPTRCEMTHIVAGIDPSLRSSGYALHDLPSGEVLSAGVLRCDGIEGYYDAAVATLLATLPSDATIVAAAVEGQFVLHNPRVALTLTRCAALWEAALYVVGCERVVWMPQPSEWRRAAGVAPKPRAKAKASAIDLAYSLGWETDREDEADAIGVAHACRLSVCGAV